MFKKKNLQDACVILFVTNYESTKVSERGYCLVSVYRWSRCLRTEVLA